MRLAAVVSNVIAVRKARIAHVNDPCAFDAAAKRRRRRKGKKGKQQAASKRRQPGAFCDSSAQCQTDRGYICEVAVNAGNSDKTCCGGPGAVCGAPTEDGDDTAPVCAVRHECVNGVCQLDSVEF